MGRALASAGADPVITSRRSESLRPSREEIEELGRRTLPLALDVRDYESVQRMAAAALDHYGEIDILVLATPADVVHWLGVIQAEAYASAKWALGTRMQEATDPPVARRSARGRLSRIGATAFHEGLGAYPVILIRPCLVAWFDGACAPLYNHSYQPQNSPLPHGPGWVLALRVPRKGSRYEAQRPPSPRPSCRGDHLLACVPFERSIRARAICRAGSTRRSDNQS